MKKLHIRAQLQNQIFTTSKDQMIRQLGFESAQWILNEAIQQNA